jgi:type IV pilus assembly protein PilA
MRDRQAGFSLIELLVVVAIILIIVAIAVPNFLRAKISANESSAVSSVHAIDTAEIAYSSMFSSIGYSVHLTDLGTGGISPCPGIATAACFIDPALANGTKSGYNFTYQQINSATPAVQFTINADPVMHDITGQKSFYSDESNIIHYDTVSPATINSPPI